MTACFLEFQVNCTCITDKHYQVNSKMFRYNVLSQKSSWILDFFYVWLYYRSPFNDRSFVVQILWYHFIQLLKPVNFGIWEIYWKVCVIKMNPRRNRFGQGWFRSFHIYIFFMSGNIFTDIFWGEPNLLITCNPVKLPTLTLPPLKPSVTAVHWD